MAEKVQYIVSSAGNSKMNLRGPFIFNNSLLNFRYPLSTYYV